MIIPFISPNDIHYRFALAMAHSVDTPNLSVMLRVLQARQKDEPTNHAVAASIQAIIKHVQDRTANRHDRQWCEISKRTRQEKRIFVDELIRDMMRDRRHPKQIEMDLGGPL